MRNNVMQFGSLLSWTPRLCAAVALGAAVLATPAVAACNAVILGAGPAPLVQYDPFDGVSRTDDLTIRFVNVGEAACTIALSIASERPGNERRMTSGTTAIPYRLETLDGRELPNDANAITGSLTLPAGRGQQGAFVVRIKLPAGVTGAAGLYEDALTIRAFSTDGGIESIGRELSRVSRARIVSRAQVNIAGASGAFGASPFALEQIDFGTLQTGAIRNAFVQVRATAPIGITISSRNAGSLEHAALGRAAQVSYAAALDGQELSLAAGPTTVSRTPPMSLDGESYPLTLRLTGSVDDLPAGEYRDVLTINVVPR
jgi:spore coat protein U-like protein